MDYSRIESVIDIAKVQRSHVAIAGIGGSADLACNLARCALGRFTLVDPDCIHLSNVARQGHSAENIGRKKVEAAADAIRRIRPDADVTCLDRDFLDLSDDEVDRYFATVDLFIFATDRFAAQAKGNQVALRLNKKAVWPGLYRGGQGGEVIFWHPGIAACFRCLASNRYRAHELALAAGHTIDPPSDGATIFDIQMLDAIAGHIALGLLTQDSDGRFGEIISQLGDRNCIQVKIGHQYRWKDRDIVREQLEVPTTNDRYFAWNAVARRDPQFGDFPCEDCEQFRDVRFVPSLAGFCREPVESGAKESDRERVRPEAQCHD